MRTFKSIVCVLVIGAAAFGAEAEYAWRDSEKYRAPDFEGNFPEDLEWGKKLEAALSGLEQRRGSLEDPFDLLRRGLRTLRVDRQMPALRWFGNTYVWGKNPQDPQAVELMYHAAGSTNSAIRYSAIYFGISTVRPMTEPILRTLVDIGMKSNDPNTLSRIAWGGAGNKDELVKFLQPYLESTDPKQKAHAEDLKKIFLGELKAFAWSAEKATAAASEKYSGKLEEIRASLVNGDSAKRKETMDLLQRESIALIMDESFIFAFAKAAEDREEKVRNAIVTTVGSQWVWGKSTQPKEAIDLMLRLSKDESRQVRYNANYYGLSTIQDRSEEVVNRMIEMLMEDGLDNRDFRGRVTWGLREEKAKVRRVLEKWMSEDAVKALFAYGFYLDFMGETPQEVPELVKTPEKVVATIVGIGATEGWRPDGPVDHLAMLRGELPGRHVLWTHDKGPPYVMAREGEVAGIRSELLNSPRFKIVAERPLTAQQIIRMGKEGTLRNLD